MTTTKTPETKTTEFENFVNLLGIYTDAENRIKEIENEANKELLDALDERKDDYSKLQETLTKTEDALKAIASAHPEWFGEKRSLDTPFGGVKMKASTWLKPENEELAILLIKEEGDKRKDFNPELYLRQKTVLDLDALGKLDDATLLKFHITREHDDNFKVEPAKVKLGKVMKAANKAEQKKAA